MKTALYLENARIAGADLTQPKLGNPGIGGTEYNFVTLTLALTEQYPNDSWTIYANDLDGLPPELDCRLALDCIDAAHKAEAAGFDNLIWRPRFRDDIKALIDQLDGLSLDVLVWAHNTPVRAYLKIFADSATVRAFVPVGHEQARLIGKHPINAKTTVICNGFHAAPYTPQGVEKDEGQVVYMGAMIPGKGFGLLARAWPCVLEARPSAKLTVIGSAQLYNRQALLGEWQVAAEAFESEDIRPYLAGPDGEPHPSVRFMGVVGQEKIPLLQRALIGVVNPSGRGENCPGSAIEFLAAGTPVVSIAREGLLDVVTHQVTGLLGPDQNALADNIITLLQDPEKARQLGAQGPGSVRRKFDYNHICAQWYELLSN